ncbi:MAG: hypothetical protein L0I79_03585 [Atopostipes sp.]|nr:hypothetical protein [Atopostipes sp.]
MKRLFIILLSTSFLVACTNNTEEGANEEQSPEEELLEENKTDKEIEEGKEAKVFIQEGPEEITIRSENADIRQLSLLSLEYDADEDELLEKETLKEAEEIAADQKTTWEVIYSEGIPNMKLVWELSTGEKGEYIIAYDGKEGLKEDELMVFPESDQT